MRSSNPVMSDKVFSAAHSTSGASMSVDGTVNKTLLLFLLVLIPAIYSWVNMDTLLESGLFLPVFIVSIVLGLVFALVTIFMPQYAMYTSPVYAALEGVVLGIFSARAEAEFPGIVMQAVGLTFGTMFTMLVLYRSRIIKVTEKFRAGVLAATGGIFVIYMVSFIGGMFGFNIPFIHGSGLIGIGFSLLVVVIAALNLVLDFDFIERASKQGLPKHMEWYGAFGLMVTLIWLYIEVLRLLMKLRGRD